ncbi:hypothetical protein [Actinacidiphila guanduensis]|uniref:Uncharacterized protein n=1 Tax=Actinacidiphila guanduensis TaxID=310781 RepID=A0A1G9XAP2_9ACTN|nr:hypothetical protein [Actinacidiphila guanduensis]SDM93810.1 hypothetical protein SAMN05216259_10264 [Actinacidiphila guanduensis]
MADESARGPGRTGADGVQAGEEDELRVLLARVVPQLAPPPQRMARVRERLRRRRRRRAAGAVAVVAAAVTAAVLLPGAGDGPGSLGPTPPTSPQAAGTPTAVAGPATGPSASTQPPSYAADARVFGELTGLRLELPKGWHTLTAPKQSTAFVSSQALGLPGDGCFHPLDDFCTPLVRQLTPGGTLIQFALEHNQGMADKARLRGDLPGARPLLTACRTVGGTSQLAAEIADGSGSDVLVVATACLSHPTPEQDALARQILSSADFS